MEVERGEREDEGRVKRKTLLEVLEQCQKALESLASLDDEDDIDWEIYSVEENRPGSSCPNFLIKEVNQLSSEDISGHIDGVIQKAGFKCEICEIQCSNLQKLEQHKNGKPHKKKMLYIEKHIKSKQVSADSSLAFRCELCKIECPTLQSLKQHYSGKQHSKKLQSVYTCCNDS